MGDAAEEAEVNVTEEAVEDKSPEGGNSGRRILDPKAAGFHFQVVIPLCVNRTE